MSLEDLRPKHERGQGFPTAREGLERFVQKEKAGSIKVQALHDMARMKELSAEVSTVARAEYHKGPYNPPSIRLMEVLASQKAVNERIIWSKDFGTFYQAYRRAKEEAERIFWAYEKLADRDSYIIGLRERQKKASLGQEQGYVESPDDMAQKIAAGWLLQDLKDILHAKHKGGS